jgi:serine O-acetyltransferase
MFDNIRADIEATYRKYKHYSFLKRVAFLIMTQELYPVLLFRFGYWVNKRCRIPLLRGFLRGFSIISLKICHIVLQVDIGFENEIGPGLRLEHFGLIGISGTLGKNCRILPHVFIGHVGAFKGGGGPTIGDNVFIGGGAKVLGEIKIGNNVIIGANAVVLKDIPDNAVVAGVPGKVVKIMNDNEVADYLARFR